MTTSPNKLKWVGNLAVIIGALLYIPLLYRVLVTRKTENLPYLWLITGIFYYCLWFIYGYANKDFALTLSATIGGVMYLLLTIAKFFIERKVK